MERLDNDSHDTWEPMSNLCGIEPELSAFEAKEKQAAEEWAKQKAAKKAAAAADKAKAQLPGGGAAEEWRTNRDVLPDRAG